MTDQLSSRLVRTRRGPVEVATAGEAGPVVLAVHGTPGDWRQARALAADLRADHRVVLPSRPGYGRTALRVGRTPGEQADAYAALLDALELDRAVVVGISGGGPSSYAFAADHPSRCAGLVLCCAVAGHLMTPPRAMRALAAMPGMWTAAATLGRARLRRQLSDDETVIAELGKGLRPVEHERLASDPRMRADLLAFAADRAAALRGAGLRNDTLQFLRATRTGPHPWPGCAVPVHVLHGDADEVVPVAHAMHHGAAIEGARVEILPGHGHALPLTTRDRLAEIVRTICAQDAAAGRGAPARPAGATPPSRD